MKFFSSTFVHGWWKWIFQTHAVFFEAVNKVLQHLETMSIATVMFTDEYGIHDRKLITLGQEAIA